jgi:chromosome partitioning protein
MSDVLARPFIAMRNDHQDALALGLAVSEYAPAGKSAEEIAQLWRWAEARLNGGPLKFAAPEAANVPALHPNPAQRVESATAQSPGGDEALTPWDACL